MTDLLDALIAKWRKKAADWDYHNRPEIGWLHRELADELEAAIRERNRVRLTGGERMDLESVRWFVSSLMAEGTERHDCLMRLDALLASDIYPPTCKHGYFARHLICGQELVKFMETASEGQQYPVFCPGLQPPTCVPEYGAAWNERLQPHDVSTGGESQ